MTEIAHQGSSEKRSIVNIFSSTRRPAPDFMTIYNHHQLSIEAIHIEGRVSRAVVACMLVKIAVPQEMAKKVLDGVNKLCKTNYTLDIVRISLVGVKDMATEPLYGEKNSVVKFAEELRGGREERHGEWNRPS